MKHSPAYQKTAFIIILLLILIFIGCATWIITSKPNESSLIADIYQNGKLIQSIDLAAVTDAYTLSVHGENGCTNTLEVRQGSIAIIAADCPDKLCVHQGFISTPLLPITCLPNHLVIQIRKPIPDHTAKDEATPDIITY